jgi:hypothetical protein
MPSLKKIAANKRNATFSAGPCTERGKARSKRNSLRHGLAAKLDTSGQIGREVKSLALAIANKNPDPCRLHFAIMAAEAEFELRGVRAARLAALTLNVLDSPSLELSRLLSSGFALLNLLRLDRYEQRALARRNRALRLLS